ncbi:MAG TPA: methyl-accepting chemotaxis protein, partial [Treponema sp.]|nr:methyl-accepting chemotaxis protein [Treponema sp.]
MKRSLSFKLIVAFAVVAVITLVVGVFGFYGLSTTSNLLETLATEDIPAIAGLQDAVEYQQRVKVAIRTLTSPFLEQDDFERQFENIEKFRQAYADFFDEYDTLPKT